MIRADNQKLKVLRRTSISPKYIKPDAELQHATAQCFTATAEFSDKLIQVEEASTNLKQKLVPKLGLDGEVHWRVIAGERVKGGLIVEEMQKEPATRETDKNCRTDAIMVPRAGVIRYLAKLTAIRRASAFVSNVAAAQGKQKWTKSHSIKASESARISNGRGYGWPRPRSRFSGGRALAITTTPMLSTLPRPPVTQRQKPLLIL
jgi:hypothetical protein